MHIPLDCGKHDLAGFLRRCRCSFCFDVGLEDGHCLFHGTGCLNHLRKKHLAFAEEGANLVHAFHERAVDYAHRVRIDGQGFGDILVQMVGYAFDQSMCQPIVDRQCAPALCLDMSVMVLVGAGRFFFGFMLGIGDELFGSFRAAIEDDIFNE